VETPVALDWGRLSERERSVLSWAARGVAQKVVALELEIAKSTVSKTLRSARQRIGFASSAQMLRAWCAVGAEASVGDGPGGTSPLRTTGREALRSLP
jgi:DNA-binding CsgD family transcriptional regulator